MDDEPSDEDLDEIEAEEGGGRRKVPADTYSKVPPSPLPQMGPDGGPEPSAVVGPPAPTPPATPDTFVCLRGPCRHYWQIRTHIVSGNPAGTFGPGGLVDPVTKQPIAEPRQITRTCLVHPGIEVELTEDVVYGCNRWDPLSPREVRKLEKRQRVYLKIYPQHASKE